MNNIKECMTFVHISSCFNGGITLIAKINIVILNGIDMKNSNHKNEEQGCTYILV